MISNFRRESRSRIRRASIDVHPRHERPLQCHGGASGARGRRVDRGAASRTVVHRFGQAEILSGIAILPQGRRRASLEAAANAIFRDDFAGRVLPFDGEAAMAYADVFSARRAAGSDGRSDDCSDRTHQRRERRHARHRRFRGLRPHGDRSVDGVVRLRDFTRGTVPGWLQKTVDRRTAALSGTLRLADIDADISAERRKRSVVRGR